MQQYRLRWSDRQLRPGRLRLHRWIRDRIVGRRDGCQSRSTSMTRRSMMKLRSTLWTSNDGAISRDYLWIDNEWFSNREKRHSFILALPWSRGLLVGASLMPISLLNLFTFQNKNDLICECSSNSQRGRIEHYSVYLVLNARRRCRLKSAILRIVSYIVSYGKSVSSDYRKRGQWKESFTDYAENWR